MFRCSDGELMLVVGNDAQFRILAEAIRSKMIGEDAVGYEMMIRRDPSKVTLHDYPGLDHGFATEVGKRRDEQGAQLADRRTAEFFAEHLG